MTPGSALALALAGLAAGSVNAVAGGGSLISFPTLVATGLAPVSANVTNTVSLWPGYLGSTVAYRRELVVQRRRVAVFGVTSIAGAIGGSLALLVAPEAVFDAVVPALIVLGCLLLLGQPRIAARIARSGGGGRRSVIAGHAATFVAAAYGAYFGGGLGVILLAVLGLVVVDEMQRINGLKTALSLVINTVALLVFALFAPVDWASVAVVAPAALLGGYVSGGLARKLPARALRLSVATLGLAVAVWLVVR